MTDTEYRQLVEFLGGQFGAIDRRFDALERRVEDGFRGVLGHLDAIYLRLERLEQEYIAITEALRRVETLLDGEQRRREALEQSVAGLRERVALLQARIEDVERRLHESP